MILDELSKKCHVTLQKNTMIIFKVSRDECVNVANNLELMKPEFARHNVTPLVCPANFEIVVINPRTKKRKT